MSTQPRWILFLFLYGGALSSSAYGAGADCMDGVNAHSYSSKMDYWSWARESLSLDKNCLPIMGDLRLEKERTSHVQDFYTAQSASDVCENCDDATGALLGPSGPPESANYDDHARVRVKSFYYGGNGVEVLKDSSGSGGERGVPLVLDLGGEYEIMAIHIFVKAWSDSRDTDLRVYLFNGRVNPNMTDYRYKIARYCQRDNMNDNWKKVVCNWDSRDNNSSDVDHGTGGAFTEYTRIEGTVNSVEAVTLERTTAFSPSTTMKTSYVAWGNAFGGRYLARATSLIFEAESNSARIRQVLIVYRKNYN